jgi:hypothetical protein
MDNKGQDIPPEEMFNQPFFFLCVGQGTACSGHIDFIIEQGGESGAGVASLNLNFDRRITAEEVGHFRHKVSL